MKNIPKQSHLFLAIFASIFILIATTANWYLSEIYDQDNFIENTYEIIQDQQVRDAISSEIVDETLSSTPILRELASGKLKPALSGLLVSPELLPYMEEVGRAFHENATSKEQKDVSLDISSLQGSIVLLSSLVDLNDEEKAIVDSIPSEIVIIPSHLIPNLYQTGITMTWLGPLAGFVGILLIAYIVLISTERLLDVQRIAGIHAGFSGLYLLAIPYVRSIQMASSETQFHRIIFGKIYDVFTAELALMIKFQFVIAIIVFALAFFIRRYEVINKLSDSIHARKTEK